MENLNLTFIGEDTHQFLDESQEQQDTSIKTDREQDEVILTTGKPHTDVKLAKQDFLDQNRPLERYAAERLEYLDADPVEFQEKIENYRKKEQQFVETDQYWYEQALALKDSEINDTDTRIATNNRIAQEVLDTYIAREETGAIDAVLDFGSMALREFVVSPYTLFRKDELETLGNEILQNKITMSSKEFREWFTGFTADYMKLGPREDNSWRLSSLIEMERNNGFRTFGDKLATRGFAALDAAGVGTLGKSAIKLATKTSRPRTLVGRVADNEGPEAAADVAEATLAKRLDPEVTNDVGPSSLNPHADAAKVSESRVSRILLENKIIKDLQTFYKNNAIGKVIPEESVKRLASETAALIGKKFGNPIYDADHIGDDLGNYTVIVQFGRATDGQPYKATSKGNPSVGAKEAAKRSGGELVPVDDGKGFVIQLRENLNLAKEIKGIDDIFEGAMALERGTARNMINDVLGGVGRFISNASERGLRNTTELAQLGEGAASAIGKLVKETARPIEALNNTDRAALAFITRNLRDNPLESARRGWYSVEEFSNKYLEFTGREATQGVKDAYSAVVEISDAAYYLQASNIMQRYIQKGYRAVKLPNGFRVPAKNIGKASVPENARILDVVDNQVTYKEFVAPNTDIWRLDKTYEGVEYVIRPKNVDALDPSDVLGYNAGGPRTNPNARWFVVAGDYNKGRLKTWLSAFTEEDVTKAIGEINTILANRGKANIDDIVKENNSWNPSVETFDDFEFFARENNWDLNTTSQLQKKERNVALSSADGDDDVFNGMAAGDFIENDMRRSDSVLPHFGGLKNTNFDPTENVVAGINGAINEFSYRAYTVNSMVSWVKRAKRVSGIKLPSNVPENDYYNQFMGAQFTGSGSEVTRMKELWTIDRRRMRVKRADEIAMINLGKSVANFVYRGTGKEIDFNDPTNFMLKVGFLSKFGFLNPKQLIIQAHHTTSIVAISPTHGPRGAGLALLMRGMYIWPEMAEKGLSRIAKRYNLNEDQLKEIMEYVRSSGRADLDTEIAELNTGYGRGISGFAGEDYTPSKLASAWAATRKTASKGVELSLLPFREGDRLARMTGTYTAILEYMAKNPGASILTEQARRQIARRDHALNFHMSSISNSPWQQGVLRLPTQWLSHTIRSMETVFNGKELTRKERAYLGAVLIPMYGAAGFGFANAADYIAEKLNMPTDHEYFTFMKWGLIDGLADVLMTDEKGRVGTGLTTSLAPMGQVRETLRLINEGRFLEVGLGPSGGIGGDIISSLWNGIVNLTDGNGTLVKEDVIKTFRNISTLDYAAKAIGIRNNGLYRSKSGATVPGEMTTTEAIMVALGFTPLKVQEFYSVKSSIYNDDKKLRKERRDINRLADKAHTMIKSGDPQQYEEGFKLLEALKLRIDLSGASEINKMSLRKSLVTPLQDELPQLILKLRKNDKTAMAERLAATLGN
jgi:DNA-binding phage protein